MWRLAPALLATLWVGTVVVSGQSSVPAVYRWLELMRSRSPSPEAERQQPAVTIPRTWDDQAVRSLQVPLAVAEASPVHVSSNYYYGIPVRPIFKSYAVYHPSKEPPGYIDWLNGSSRTLPSTQNP